MTIDGEQANYRDPLAADDHGHARRTLVDEETARNGR